MFADGFGNGSLDLPAGQMIGENIVNVHVLIGHHAARVRKGLQRERSGARGDLGVGSAVLPTQFLNEQRAEIEVLQTLRDVGFVECRHRDFLGLTISVSSSATPQSTILCLKNNTNSLKK